MPPSFLGSADLLADRAGPLPPRRPVDWPSVHRAIGSVLPGDYRRLVERTGSIRVGEFLTIFAPGAANANVDLVVQMGACLGALRELKTQQADWGEGAFPYPLWFEPGGLLPWGASDNGDTLYWRTRGLPDLWTVVVGEARGPEWAEFPGSACEFLAEYLSGRLKVSVFPTNALGSPTVRLVDPPPASR